MPTIAVQGSQAHYREWGQGEETILMLHGWPADSSHYSELAPMLAQQGFRIIVPDLPGWGLTPPPATAWSVNDYMRWVQHFVEAMRLPSAVYLFGHSFGGRVAIKFILQYPYHVRALVLCASAGIKPNPYTMRRRTLRLMAKVGQGLFAIPGLRLLAPLARKVLYRAAGSTDYLKAEGVMKQTIVRVLEEDLSPLLPEIKHPTMVLWGTDDNTTPLHDGETMAKRLPHSQFVVIPGGRHNLVKQQPAAVAEQLLTFIRSEDVQAI